MRSSVRGQTRVGSMVGSGPHCRVELEHTLQHADDVVVRGEHVTERPVKVAPPVVSHVLAHRARILRDPLEDTIFWDLDDLANGLELVQGVVPREESLSQLHLGHDATKRPHVHFVAVSCRAEQDLGRAVPSRRHIIRDDSCVVVLLSLPACKAKVADLQQGEGGKGREAV